MKGVALALAVGSLFSGIGGLDLGLEWAGHQVVWQVERDLYARKVLRQHWPRARLWADVTQVGAAQLPWVHVIAGGFPCQDISPANPTGRGLAGARSGLWSEYARIVQEVRPLGVLVENNGQNRARWLPTVLGDLDALGFDAEWHCITAAAVGAPHQRDRCFVFAYRAPDAADANRFASRGLPVGTGAEYPVVGVGRGDLSDPAGVGRQQGLNQVRPRESDLDGRGQAGQSWAVADPNGQRKQQPQRVVSDLGRRPADGRQQVVGRDLPDADDARREAGGTLAARAEQPGAFLGRPNRSGLGAVPVLPRKRGVLVQPPQPARRGLPVPATGGVGLQLQPLQPSEWWAAEPDVGRVAHGVPARAHRLRGLGNAVVPHIAEWWGHRIAQVAAELAWPVTP